MRKLKNLSALLIVTLFLVSACGQDENFEEVEQTIENEYDPDDDKGNGGGMGGD